MKTLTVSQPHASLIAWGEKTIEYRTWGTAYRGPLLIHASAQQYTADDGESTVLLPFGVIVAVVDLIDIRPFAAADLAAANMSAARSGLAWVIANPRQVSTVRAKGMQRLWDFSGAVHELPADSCHVSVWHESMTT